MPNHEKLPERIETGMAITSLPTSPSIPTQEGIPTQTIHLIYGLPKIGKSTLAAQYPFPIFFATESGLSQVSCYQIPIESYADAVAAAKLLRKDCETPTPVFKTVVIDTVDMFYTICMKHSCEKLNIDHPADAGYGKGWEELSRTMLNFINGLAMLPLTVVLIAHEREEKEEVSGRIIVRPTGLGDGIAKKLQARADLIVRCAMRTNQNGEEERGIRFKPTDRIVAGGRLNKEIIAELPDVLPLEFRSIEKLYYKKLESAPEVTIPTNKEKK